MARSLGEPQRRPGRWIACAVVIGLLGCATTPASVSSAPPAATVEVAEPEPSPPAPEPEEPQTDVAPPISSARGWLGVELRAAEAGQPGVLVANVVRAAPAESAGLTAGDVILQIDGQTVSRPEDVVGLIGQRRAGQRVSVGFRRGTQQRLVAATLAPLPNKDDILRMSYVGAPAPAFGTLKTVQGALTPALPALRGKVVVLEFWAGWCTVCPILVPTMNDWHARFGAQGMEVIGVTTDHVAAATATANQLGMRYPIWSDESGETTEAYRALALPTVFIIDRGGVVRDVMVGYSTGRLRELEALVGRLVRQQ